MALPISSNTIQTDMTKDQLLSAIVDGITRQEGFGLPNSRATKNNNPGNLRTWGTRPINGGYAFFPTKEDGFKALNTQVSKLYTRNVSLYEFFAGQRDENGRLKPGGYYGYCPLGDGANNPLVYAMNVAAKVQEKTGESVDIHKPLQEIPE